jgi:hypothetical protein
LTDLDGQCAARNKKRLRALTESNGSAHQSSESAMNNVTLRQTTLDDYDVVYDLWKSTPGIGLSASDERDAIAAFLRRNPGLSTVAISSACCAFQCHLQSQRGMGGTTSCASVSRR